MLKYFESGFDCKVLIDGDISDEDLLVLEKLFNDEYASYNLEFIKTYTFPSSLLRLLYTQMELYRKNISIVVHTSRLSRYLHVLGIDSKFSSHLQDRYISNPNAKVIAIGGSADSGEKIMQILSSIDTTQFIIFIIQHVCPDKDGVLDEILSRLTSSKVSYAKNGENVKVGHIYIASKDKHMLVVDNLIVLESSEAKNSARPSISVSFESLSDMYKDNLLAILECGYGFDGVSSLERLKKNSSCVIIQDPSGCRADTIVKEALSQKKHNFVFSTSDIISYINTISLEFTTSEAWIQYLLDEIYIRYEYDFRLYQMPLVKRRIEAFMIKHSIKDMKHLVILVLYFKTAFRLLLFEISINVTEFFRKTESSIAMLEVLHQYKNSYSIKIWSAGSSSGEEVYSTAIMLSELGMLEKSLLYATDFNPVVIQEAKNGIYPIDAFQRAKEKYNKLNFSSTLDSYFEINTKFIEIKDKIKKKVMFFVHNLEKDSVFNEFDIIECKNVLIYFNEELQEHVFKLFYDSLKFGGYLFLGVSETLPRCFEGKFKICEKSYKTYKKVA